MSRRQGLARVAPYAAVLLFLVVVLFSRQPNFTYTLGLPHRALRETPVDTQAVLDHVPARFADKQFTWNNDNGMLEDELATLGTLSTTVELDGREIIDVITGEKLTRSAKGVFNLSLLKLPRGSKWGFLGVARGPPRQLPWMSLNGASITLMNNLVM
jgi:hypothetical protein